MCTYYVLPSGNSQKEYYKLSIMGLLSLIRKLDLTFNHRSSESVFITVIYTTTEVMTVVQPSKLKCKFGKVRIVILIKTSTFPFLTSKQV